MYSQSAKVNFCSAEFFNYLSDFRLSQFCCNVFFLKNFLPSKAQQSLVNNSNFVWGKEKSLEMIKFKMKLNLSDVLIDFRLYLSKKLLKGNETEPEESTVVMVAVIVTFLLGTNLFCLELWDCFIFRVLYPTSSIHFYRLDTGPASVIAVL